MYQCRFCPKTFPKEHGRNTHESLKHNKRSVRSSTGSTIAAAPKGAVRNLLRKVLASNPSGMSIAEIETGMRAEGWSPKGNGRSYVSQSAASDPDIVRVERGMYRLKTSIPQSRAITLASQPIPDRIPSMQLPETNGHDVSKDALMLRIQTLEALNRGLRDALQSFMRSTSEISS